MRRPAPNVQISPGVLRQFALITLIVTALLAMFANGENAEFAQAIKDREAKNKLARTQANKLGADKVGTAIRQEKREESGEGFEKLNDHQQPASSASTPVSGGWAGNDTMPSGYRPAFLSVDTSEDFVKPAPKAPKMPQGVKVRRKKSVIFTEREREALKRAAIERSGVSSTADIK